MAVNLIDKLQNEFTDDAIGKIGSFVGETPANTKTGLGLAIPAILGTLVQKSQTTQGAADLFGMLQRGGFDGAFGGVSSMLKGGSGAADALKVGAPLLSSLFGSRQNSLTDWISSTVGLRPQSSASLLGIAAPFILNMVGREATAAGGFNASSVAKLLSGQMGFLRHIAPAGLASMIGLSGWDEPARSYPAAEPARSYAPPAGATEPPPVHDRPAGGMGWLKWALPLLLLALLIWGFTGLRNRDSAREPLGAAASPGASPVATSGTVALVKQRLTCGQELDVAPNGVETRLISFIDDKSSGVTKETWLTFDRLDFETGSANLRPSSQAQVRNIADILKCYRGVNVKIGGYTDNVGDPSSNLRLSQARAENTRQAIVVLGIEPARLEAEGYGEQHPVASNDTDDGRQRNRRIDVLVTKK